MAIPRLKSTRAAERKKVSLARKYSEQGKETGGGRIGLKKARRTLEARRFPAATRTRSSQAGKKQRKGRRRST